MANKKQIETAKEIFLSDEKIERLFMNTKGEFFTNINYAKNSLAKDEKIETLTRKGVLKNNNSLVEPTKNIENE